MPMRAEEPPVNYDSDQIVVKIMPAADIDAINNSYSTSTVRPLLNTADIYLLQAASAADASKIVTARKCDPAIQYAELNVIASALEAN